MSGGGRDLTAQDVADVQQAWVAAGMRGVPDRRFVADELNRIARPNTATGGLRQGIRRALGIDDAVTVDDAGLVADVEEWIRVARVFAPKPVPAAARPVPAMGEPMSDDPARTDGPTDLLGALAESLGIADRLPETAFGDCARCLTSADECQWHEDACCPQCNQTAGGLHREGQR